MPNWRHWLRRNFGDYNELANAVLGQLDLPMPEIDLGNIRAAPIAARRTVTPPAGGKGLVQRCHQKLCHTGEGRCPWRKWVPAFAGKTKEGNAAWWR